MLAITHEPAVYSHAPVFEIQTRYAFEILNIARDQSGRVFENASGDSQVVAADTEFLGRPQVSVGLEETFGRDDLATSAGHEKSLIAEINDDILAYGTKYGNLFFIVYDCGIIRDVDRFITSFESHGAVYVRIVKH